jgi:hypothetical protein
MEKKMFYLIARRYCDQVEAVEDGSSRGWVSGEVKSTTVFAFLSGRAFGLELMIKFNEEC